MSTTGATRAPYSRSYLAKLLTALTLCAPLTLSLYSAPSHAKKKAEEVYSVRYSYERLSRITASGPQKRYVLMPQPLAVPLEVYQVPKDRYRAHFDALKSNKSSNYGKTGFNTSKEDEDVVLIFLDKDKQVNHPFLMAELIYTLIDAGAKHVEFPRSSFSGRPYTKADISYSAYQLTLPYWEGLPPQQLSGGLLSFPDGTLITANTLLSRLSSKDEALINHMIESLKSGELDAVTAIVNATEALQKQDVTFSELSSGFIPLLSAASKAMRLLALRGLKGVDQSAVNKKLREVMDEDPEADVQAQAALQLSQSKDKKYSEVAQFFALRSNSPEAIKAAARGLAQAKTKEATAKLLKALPHDDPEVRAEIIQALLTRKAQGELTKTLKSELNLATKVDVALALISDKKADVKETAYEFLTRQPNGEAAARAATALADEKRFKPTLPLLSELCKHPEAMARLAAFESLKRLGGKEALEALTQADINQKETGALAHDTMRAIYAQLKTPEVLKAAQSSDELSLKSAAAGALGVRYQADKKYRKKIFSVAQSLMSDSAALVRAEVARSLGEIKSDEAKVELIKLSKEDAIEVKRLVAYAWRNYDEESARDVLNGNLGSDDVPLLVNSLDSLGLLGSVKSLSKIRVDSFLTHKEALVRRASIGALAALAPKLEGKARAGVVSHVSPLIKDPDLEVQLRVTKTLGASPNSESEFALAANFESGSEALTLAIIDALVQHKTVSAIESLSAVIEINKSSARKKMYALGAQLKDPALKGAFKAILEKALKREQDAALKSLLEEELKKL